MGTLARNGLKFAQNIDDLKCSAEPKLRWTEVTGRFVVDSKY